MSFFLSVSDAGRLRPSDATRGTSVSPQLIQIGGRCARRNLSGRTCTGPTRAAGGSHHGHRDRNVYNEAAVWYQATGAPRVDEMPS